MTHITCRTAQARPSLTRPAKDQPWRVPHLLTLSAAAEITLTVLALAPLVIAAIALKVAMSSW